MAGFNDLLAVTPLALSPSGEAQGGAILPTGALEAQEKDNWCWAAVTRLLLHLRGKATRQCEVATWGLGKPCCVAHAPDEPANLDEVLDKQEVSIAFDMRAAEFFADPQAAFATLRAKIDAGLPTPLMIRWLDGQPPHYVCVIGYGLIDQQPALWLYDPRDVWSSQGNRRKIRISDMASGIARAPGPGPALGGWCYAYILG